MQQLEKKKTRRIRQISVTNLFGTFNHVIPLNMDERITIIHGPNGFGKTMILKLLRALFGQSSYLLQITPFDELRIDFEDNTSFWVSKPPRSHESIGDGYSTEHEIIFHATGEKPYTLPPRTLQWANVATWQSLIDRTITTLDRIGPGIWRNMLTGETLSFEDVVEHFGRYLPRRLPHIRTGMPEWLIDMRKSIPIHFVGTQRLLRPSQSSQHSEDETVKSEHAVIEDAKHLAEVIKRKLADSASSSQSIDSTFPARLINPTAQQLQITKNELLDKLQKLEKKRSQLMAFGLLAQETGSESPIDSDKGIEDSTKAVLAVYIEDTERKLGFFDELANKLDLLTTIINKHFLYKTLSINKEKGLIFTTEDGINLPLENLSSGEQNELVLFYDLLFRVSPGSLILIDEPELSLHVVWQEQFLKDMQRVTMLTDTDILVATHSPDIIDKRRDLVVRLKIPENGNHSK